MLRGGISMGFDDGRGRGEGLFIIVIIIIILLFFSVGDGCSSIC